MDIMKKFLLVAFLTTACVSATRAQKTPDKKVPDKKSTAQKTPDKKVPDKKSTAQKTPNLNNLDIEYIDDRFYVYQEESSFGQNPFLRSLENQPFIDVPGQAGRFAVGGVGLLVGIPFVMIGQTVYFPFSGQRKFYPGMKKMYFSYYDFIMNEFRYSGYYLLAMPFYCVKMLLWDGPIYLYESAFGAEIEEDEKNFPKTVDE